MTSLSFIISQHCSLFVCLFSWKNSFDHIAILFSSSLFYFLFFILCSENMLIFMDLYMHEGFCFFFPLTSLFFFWCLCASDVWLTFPSLSVSWRRKLTSVSPQHLRGSLLLLSLLKNYWTEGLHTSTPQIDSSLSLSVDKRTQWHCHI